MTGHTEPPRLTAYRLVPNDFGLVPSEPRRPWMDATPNSYANRCLPLLIANQSGWLVLNDATVRLRWNGGPELEDLHVQYDLEPPPIPAVSHFGSGIVTWRLPFLFRTPPGWNLVVRGAPNNPRPGAQPLDAVVETDWATSPFTMNWQLLRPHEEVVVQAGEPLCLLFPQRRGELESFQVEVLDVAREPELAAQLATWTSSRMKFLADLPNPDSEARRQGWQREYFRGRGMSAAAPEHQTRLRLQPFRERPES